MCTVRENSPNNQDSCNKNTLIDTTHFAFSVYTMYVYMCSEWPYLRPYHYVFFIYTHVELTILK